MLRSSFDGTAMRFFAAKVKRRVIRARPLDWRLSQAAAREPAGRVDIVIPVYGAAADLEACLASVLRWTDLARHSLRLIVDGPQGADVESVLARIASAEIVRRPARGGFTATANDGLRLTQGDVVLLNSDTVVSEGWLEGLIRAAASDRRIGTVTPFSNNASLCSLPVPFEENLLPAGHTVDSFAAVVRRVSTREYPRIPTGVGFCLYIVRELIDEIGTLDEHGFGRGYGEENDFSLRALKRGWVHVLDDATFVYHAGRRSFGRSGLALQRAGHAMLEWKHPEYLPTIGRFMREDPLAAARARVIDALRTKPRRTPSQPGVVHLVHGWPPFNNAGTELYAWRLAQGQATARDVAVYARIEDPQREQGSFVEISDEGMRVRLAVNNFVQRDPLSRNAISDKRLEKDFEQFLRDLSPAILHVHHLAGHSFSLARVARKFGVPVVYQLQDWWSLCARVNLFDRWGNRCSGPSLGKCSACVDLTRFPPAAVNNRMLHALRSRAAREAIGQASAVIAGSEALIADFRHLLPSDAEVHVIPYGVPAASLRRQRAAALPLRFGILGAVQAHKGADVAAAAFAGIAPQTATLHLWGDWENARERGEELRQKGGAAVILEEPFLDSERYGILATLDVLIVPSVGLESFGLAAREALACGVPVIASADGALPEMFRDASCGALFPNGDARALRAVIESVISDPRVIDGWAATIPPQKSTDAHAREVERVYESVLDRRRARC